MAFQKKSLGQHFLVNQAISNDIVYALKPIQKPFKVAEIGPGQGALTRELSQRNDIDEFYLVELDDRLIGHLKKNYPSVKKVFHESILELDIPNAFNGQISLIGNLPYNISSQIVFKIIENRDFVPQMVAMFQKEVAERIAAKSGSKTYGVTSVLTQAFYDVEYLFDVSKDNFDPPPKVESGVIRVLRKENQKIDCNEKTLFKVVKMAFGQRRKKLSNALAMYKDHLPKAHLDKRAEQLSVAEFIKIAKIVDGKR